MNFVVPLESQTVFPLACFCFTWKCCSDKLSFRTTIKTNYELLWFIGCLAVVFFFTFFLSMLLIHTISLISLVFTCKLFAYVADDDFVVTCVLLFFPFARIFAILSHSVQIHTCKSKKMAFYGNPHTLCSGKNTNCTIIHFKWPMCDV